MQPFLQIPAYFGAMPVSLDFDPASEPHSGLRRLRQLASFGRYGADLHPSVSLPAKPSSKPAHEGNVLASSLSSFYGWLSRQAGHTVNFSSKPSAKIEKHKASLVWIRPCVANGEANWQMCLITQLDLQERKAPAKPAKRFVAEASTSTKPAKRKPISAKDKVQLPAIFTLQVFSNMHNLNQ